MDLLTLRKLTMRIRCFVKVLIKMLCLSMLCVFKLNLKPVINVNFQGQQNHDDRKWGTYLILQNQFTDNNILKKI